MTALRWRTAHRRASLRAVAQPGTDEPAISCGAARYRRCSAARGCGLHNSDDVAACRCEIGRDLVERAVAAHEHSSAGHHDTPASTSARPPWSCNPATSSQGSAPSFVRPRARISCRAAKTAARRRSTPDRRGRTRPTRLHPARSLRRGRSTSTRSRPARACGSRSTAPCRSSPFAGCLKYCPPNALRSSSSVTFAWHCAAGTRGRGNRRPGANDEDRALIQCWSADVDVRRHRRLDRVALRGHVGASVTEAMQAHARHAIDRHDAPWQRPCRSTARADLSRRRPSAWMSAAPQRRRDRLAGVRFHGCAVAAERETFDRYDRPRRNTRPRVSRDGALPSGLRGSGRGRDASHGWRRRSSGRGGELRD